MPTTSAKPDRASLEPVRPPWAMAIWHDREALYLEIPMRGNPPYVTRFPFSEQGLMKALNVLKEVHEKAKASVPTNGHGPRPHPAIKRMERGREVQKFTDEQREAARKVLEKLKLI